MQQNHNKQQKHKKTIDKCNKNAYNSNIITKSKEQKKGDDTYVRKGKKDFRNTLKRTSKIK